jgi:hypothetical protein
MINIHDDSRETIFIDIDGVIVSKNYNPSIQPEHYLVSTIQYLIKHKDDVIILTTSRPYAYCKKILDYLAVNNIIVRTILTDLPTGKRTLINDNKAEAINIISDTGMSGND